MNKNEQIEFENCCNYITSKNKNCNFKNLEEIKIVLKNIIDERIIYLLNNGIHKDKLNNDMELVDCENYYVMISRQIYYSKEYFI